MPDDSDNTIYTLAGQTAVNGLGGADRFFWNPSLGALTITGGDTGERYDPNPYNTGNPGGDRLFLTGTQGVWTTFSTTESGTVSGGLIFRGIERVHATEGNDVLDASYAVAAPARWGVPQHGVTLFGNGGHDVLRGSRYDDVLDGGEGNDRIAAGDGNDFVQASGGNDLVYGGRGEDNIRWAIGGNKAPGNDVIFGGEGLDGGGDLINVWVSHQGGNIGGTPGANVVYTGAESGTATTTMGGVLSTLRFYEFELLWTHEYNDRIDASGAAIAHNATGINAAARWGNDTLIGSAGRDTISGDSGADLLIGGRGDDVIATAGGWYDIWSGGDGDADRLVFRAGDGRDTVIGFDAGRDILDVGGRSYTAREQWNGTLLSFADGDSILLGGEFDFI